MKRTVLVIDDDEWLLDSYSRTLTGAGYKVQRAANALQAMDVIDRHTPQVIILDLFMPGPNGLVLLHELRSHSDLGGIPVVLVTNAAASLPADALEPYGVVQVLDKSVMQPIDIVTAVRRLV